MVTVCGALQLAGVNLISDTDRVPSVMSEELSGMVTSAVGSEVNTMVNVAVVPASEVSPEIADTTMLAVSLSILVDLFAGNHVAPR